MLDPQVVQAARHFHHLVRDAFLRTAQHVLDDTTPLDPGQRMLDADPDPGQLAIRLLFGFRQVALRWLFFGM